MIRSRLPLLFAFLLSIVSANAYAADAFELLTPEDPPSATADKSAPTAEPETAKKDPATWQPDNVLLNTDVSETPKEEAKTTQKSVCPVCGGTGYREIGGARVPCLACGGAKEVDTPANKTADEKNEPSEADAKTSSSPPANSNALPGAFPTDPTETVDDAKPEAVKPLRPDLLLKRREESLRRSIVPVEESPLVPASALVFHTPWGNIPVTRPNLYQHKVDRGPGITVKVPQDWVVEERKHAILGGMQHRYTAPDGLSRVVAVIFPMNSQEDLATFLGKKQTDLFTSFKFMQARQAVLGRRTGIVVHYQGILLMRDATCYLFLTRYNGKGYLIYGLFFNYDGGQDISKVMNSVRIF